MYNQNNGIVVIGRGGQARALKDVIDSITSYSISRTGRLFVKEFVDYDNLRIEAKANYVIGFGSLKNIEMREKIYNKVLDGGGNVVTIISPTATVSSRAHIGAGTTVMPRAFIGPGVKIGCNCLVNTGSIIEHDSEIGDHSLVLTNSTINGGCKIGQKCMIGSGAVVLHGLTIASKVTIGALACVTKNLTPGTYVGCPAKRLERRLTKK